MPLGGLIQINGRNRYSPNTTKSSSARVALLPGGKNFAGVCPAKAPFGYPSFRITTLLLFHMQKLSDRVL